MCTNMGGFGNAGEYKSESVTIGRWTIKDGYLYRDDVKEPIRGDRWDEIPQNDIRLINLIKKAGGDPKDYVRVGNALVTREVALTAQRQHEAAQQAKQARFDKNVPGLRELERAIAHDSDLRERAVRSIERGDGVLRGSLTSNTAAELRKKYPRANAYLHARAYAMAANVDKASAGREAMRKIEEGKSYKKAIAEMEREWTKAARKHMWD